MNTKKKDNSKKITKWSLVIYSFLMLAVFITALVLSINKKNYAYLWGNLLCVGPSIFYVIISIAFNSHIMLKTTTNRKLIGVLVSLYTLKYLLIICIPIIGIVNPHNFNLWFMLATTLVAPTFIIAYKLIIANYVSKNSNSKQKTSKNSIEF